MAPQPPVLIDEPGLDLRQIREAAATLRKHVSSGRTLFLSIHQIADAGQLMAVASRRLGRAAPPDFEEVFLALARTRVEMAPPKRMARAGVIAGLAVPSPGRWGRLLVSRSSARCGLTQKQVALNGTAAGVGEAFSPLVGIWAPTFSACELAAPFPLPFCRYPPSVGRIGKAKH